MIRAGCGRKTASHSSSTRSARLPLPLVELEQGLEQRGWQAAHELVKIARGARRRPCQLGRPEVSRQCRHAHASAAIRPRITCAAGGDWRTAIHRNWDAIASEMRAGMWRLCRASGLRRALAQQLAVVGAGEQALQRVHRAVQALDKTQVGLERRQQPAASEIGPGVRRL